MCDISRSVLARKQGLEDVQDKILKTLGDMETMTSEELHGLLRQSRELNFRRWTRRQEQNLVPVAAV